MNALVLLNGRACGAWNLLRGKKAQKVIVEPFEPLSNEVWESIEIEVKDIARFLNLNVNLERGGFRDKV